MRARPALVAGVLLAGLTACGSTVQQRFPLSQTAPGGAVVDGSGDGIAQPGGTAAPGGRVRIVIQPGSPQGKPCSAPGPKP